MRYVPYTGKICDCSPDTSSCINPIDPLRVGGSRTHTHAHTHTHTHAHTVHSITTEDELVELEMWYQ